MNINELIKEKPCVYLGEVVAMENVLVKPLTEMTPLELRCISIHKPFLYFDGSYEAAVMAIKNTPSMFVYTLNITTNNGQTLDIMEKNKLIHHLIKLVLDEKPQLVGVLLSCWRPGPSDESISEMEYRMIEYAASKGHWALHGIPKYLTDGVQKRLLASKHYNNKWIESINDPANSTQRAYVDDKAKFTTYHAKVQFLSEYNIDRAKKLYKDNPAIMHSLEARVNGRLPEGYKPLLETAMEQTERIMINGGK